MSIQSRFPAKLARAFSNADEPVRQAFRQIVASVATHCPYHKGHPGNYHRYDPGAFNPEVVHFDNPGKRWRMAFAEGGR